MLYDVLISMYVNENVEKGNIRSQNNGSVITISLRPLLQIIYTTKSELIKFCYVLALICYQRGSIERLAADI